MDKLLQGLPVKVSVPINDKVIEVNLYADARRGSLILKTDNGKDVNFKSASKDIQPHKKTTEEIKIARTRMRVVR